MLREAMSAMIQTSENGVTFAVHVTPRARKDEIAGLHGDAIWVRITAPPVEGAANAHLLKFLAKELGVSTVQVEIVAGWASRRKLIAVRDITVSRAEAVLLASSP